MNVTASPYPVATDVTTYTVDNGGACPTCGAPIREVFERTRHIWADGRTEVRTRSWTAPTVDCDCDPL